MKRNPPDAETEVFHDPITGTTPAGPIQTVHGGGDELVDPASGDRRWSMAARVFIGLLVLIAVIFALGVMFRPWG